MTYHPILAMLLVILSISCNTKSQKIDDHSLIDSILVKHFKAVESAEDFDSTDINYKVLKAYVNNDIIFLKNRGADIVDNERNNEQWQFLDSCIHQPKIQSLPVDEAYRFVYLAGFCPYKINVTVSRKGDSSNLHFILYQYKWDTADCRIISEYDKAISPKNWKEIIESLNECDFWGLKKDNGVHGVDGSTLTVTGFRQRDSLFNSPAKFNYVYRWSPYGLSGPFQLILKLSGNKKGCFWVV